MGNLKKVFLDQKEFFKTGKTKNIDFRIDALKKLKKAIKENEEDFLIALNKDLGKSKFEGYATEIGIVYDEINIHLKNLRYWVRKKKVKSSIIYFPSKNYIYKEPYGVALIIGPFNYPFQLVIAPLIGAISAGNCAVIKPSESSLNTALLLEKVINKIFQGNYIKVVAPTEGKEAVTELINTPYDYIFFTGSVGVGKIVMEAAAKNLTPLTLELGGKSPCIVDKDSKIELAAKRIVWGKLLNAGQTCVAPDYLMVHKDIKDELLKKLVEEIEKQYGKDIKNNEEYPRIIRERDTEKLKEYFNDGKIYYGGEYDISDRFIHPTILTDVQANSPVMENEIFGPILPVIEFSDIDEAINFVNSRPKPLALYYFSESSSNIEKVLKDTTSGGVTINDTVIHVAQTSLPFGGVGNSGMGDYHGKASFETFSHSRSVVKRGTFIEFNIRFAPFKDKIKLLKKVMK
ncbi:aldehyde dehydrogenase [Clostridium thermobutyricum]|uniref:Aldehyde dehydrogenase n=1 Tax=Clostridium thermobutyricum DSM 4928 TaxID=1121339 RepID=A0A1V4T0T5_9CLOT|nr:aldehyde dehydrogenase [Clostridium thermobutyricum]OPX50837.1 NAD(P)-dependent benzaldehyde dehydrogenase [Clostridium thermobutyricum DSM 4928]